MDPVGGDRSFDRKTVERRRRVFEGCMCGKTNGRNSAVFAVDDKQMALLSEPPLLLQDRRPTFHTLKNRAARSLTTFNLPMQIPTFHPLCSRVSNEQCQNEVDVNLEWYDFFKQLSRISKVCMHFQASQFSILQAQ